MSLLNKLFARKAKVEKVENADEIGKITVAIGKNKTTTIAALVKNAEAMGDKDFEKLNDGFDPEDLEKNDDADLTEEEKAAKNKKNRKKSDAEDVGKEKENDESDDEKMAALRDKKKSDASDKEEEKENDDEEEKAEEKKNRGKKNGDKNSKPKNANHINFGRAVEIATEYLEMGSKDEWVIRKLMDDGSISYDEANRAVIKAKSQGDLRVNSDSDAQDRKNIKYDYNNLKYTDLRDKVAKDMLGKKWSECSPMEMDRVLKEVEKTNN